MEERTLDLVSGSTSHILISGACTKRIVSNVVSRPLHRREVRVQVLLW